MLMRIFKVSMILLLGGATTFFVALIGIIINQPIVYPWENTVGFSGLGAVLAGGTLFIIVIFTDLIERVRWGNY